MWINEAEYAALADNYERARREIDALRKLAAVAAPLAAHLRPDANPKAKTPVGNDELALLANVLAEHDSTSPTL